MTVAGPSVLSEGPATGFLLTADSLLAGVLLEEAEHLGRGVGALGVGVGAGLAAAGPGVAEAVDVPALDDGPAIGVPVGDPGKGVAVRHPPLARDRKSTRLNSSHANISYAVFSLIKNTNSNLSYR